MSWLRRVGRAMAAVSASMIVAPVGYLTVLTIAGHTAHRRRVGGPGSQRSERFVVVIPAHDEERLIGRTVRSVVDACVPSMDVAVHVVADNCTDATAAMAVAAGAVVHERTAPDRPGKGPALSWLLDRLSADLADDDVVVFLDADTMMDGQFFEAATAALGPDVTVAQGHYSVLDDGASPVVAFRMAALAARNYLRPLGRVTIGGTAGLYGNGMLFRARVLREHRFSDHLTEDAELQLELLEAGIRVAFFPLACVAAEMPDTLDAARSQHQRWERGRVQIARRHARRLCRRVVLGGPAGRVAYADAAFDVLVPPLSVLVAGNVAWGVAAAGVSAIDRRSVSAPRHLTAAVGCGVLQSVYVAAALATVGAPPRAYRSLAQAPRMVVWKLGIWVGALAGRTPQGWVRTARNATPAATPGRPSATSDPVAG